MDPNTPPRNAGATLIVSWLVVGLPLAWGIWQTLQKSQALLR